MSAVTPSKQTPAVIVEHSAMAAVITGGNKGIGFEVAKQLLAVPSSRRRFNELIIACRNPKLGVEAAERLGCRSLAWKLVKDPGGKCSFALDQPRCLQWKWNFESMQ